MEAKIPMNLQFFGANEEDGDAAQGNEDDTGLGQTEPKKTFDDILSDEEYKAEFERRIQQESGKQKAKYELLMNNKLSEAEKLAKMNEEEKAEYQRNQKERELNERETKIERKERMAEARNKLTAKNIPSSLAELLQYDSEESCNQSIEKLEAAWKQSVEKAVEEQLKGGVPLKKAPANTPQQELEKQIYNIMSGK